MSPESAVARAVANDQVSLAHSRSANVVRGETTTVAGQQVAFDTVGAALDEYAILKRLDPVMAQTLFDVIYE